MESLRPKGSFYPTIARQFPIGRERKRWPPSHVPETWCPDIVRWGLSFGFSLLPPSRFARNKLCSQEWTKQAREPLPYLPSSFPPSAFCKIYYSDIFTSIRYLTSFACILPSAFLFLRPVLHLLPFFSLFTSASITECTLPRSQHPFHSGRLHAKPFKSWRNTLLGLYFKSDFLQNLFKRNEFAANKLYWFIIINQYNLF